jgi:hypothetical protein
MFIRGYRDESDPKFVSFQVKCQVKYEFIYIYIYNIIDPTFHDVHDVCLKMGTPKKWIGLFDVWQMI